jgi:NAD(P)-dependent dehydrogenase (short-subunit alcohol dehydrogenase family)
MSRLQGKVALITGGSSGLGLATALRFAKEGAFVYITGRRQHELDMAAALIGDGVATIRGDVQNSHDLDRLYERIKREKGKIDILVANAGFIDPEPLDGATEENFDKTFGINVRGLLFTVQKALLLLRDGGAIILISSIAAFKGIPRYTAYCATKASVRSVCAHMDGRTQGSWHSC